MIIPGSETYLSEFIAGNFDGDGDVDFVDFAIFGAYWAEGECGKCCGADLTCDAEVDLSDLREFSANWLAGVEELSP